MSKYLGLFVSESSEHLEAFGRDLLALEKDAGSEAIDSLFRHAHSVKGMASSMGFEPVAKLAHRVEDLVDALRADPSRRSRELVDLLLSAADTLMGQVRQAGAGAPIDDALALYEAVAKKVTELTGKSPEPTRVAQLSVTPTPPARVADPEEVTVSGRAPAPAPAPANEPERSEGGLGLPPRFSVKLRILPSCQVPGVRAFLVQKRLSTVGNLFDLKPPLEDLKAGRIPEGKISVEIETSGGEAAIAGVLKNIPEVELAAIAKVSYAPATAAPAPEPKPSEPRPIGVESGRTVRVKTELLDRVLDSVGELLLATSRLRELGKAVPEPHRPPLDEGIYRMHALVRDLHNQVMSVRMTPLATITDRLPRAARDIARKRNRDVDLVITGAEIELDRAILDELSDPLLHVLRNSIDHGIESPEERAAAGKGPRGRVLVAVRRVRDRVAVEIEDDGRGMNAEKLKSAAIARGLLTAEAAARLSPREAYLLSCMPGVSTAEGVTDISGRGVGMDAVKRAVENVGGTLEIESELGRGTRITLTLPLSVAVVNLLLVRLGEEIFGLPIAKVSGAVEADDTAISRSRGAPMLPHGQALLPVHPLSGLLGLSGAQSGGRRPYVVVEAEPGKVALQVDALMGQEEAVLKPLPRPLDLIPGLSGVTILGTGRPVFILDVPRLLT